MGAALYQAAVCSKAWRRNAKHFPTEVAFVVVVPPRGGSLHQPPPSPGEISTHQKCPGPGHWDGGHGGMNSGAPPPPESIPPGPPPPIPLPRCHRPGPHHNYPPPNHTHRAHAPPHPVSVSMIFVCRAHMYPPPPAGKGGGGELGTNGEANLRKRKKLGLQKWRPSTGS